MNKVYFHENQYGGGTKATENEVAKKWHCFGVEF